MAGGGIERGKREALGVHPCDLLGRDESAKNESEFWGGFVNIDKIGKYIVAVPVFHLIISSMFLWGWTTGFGSNAVVLADAKDIFSISISDMVAIYFGGLITPILYILLRKDDVKSSSDDERGSYSIDELGEKIEELKLLLTKLKRRNFLILFVFYALGIIGIIWSIHRFASGMEMGTSIAMVPFLFLAIILSSRFVREIKDGYSLFISIAVFGLVTSSMSNGLIGGQSARYSTYENTRHSALHCHDSAVIRRLGDSFIVVTKFDDKLVTNLECNPKLIVPMARPERKLTLRLTPTLSLLYELKNSEPRH